MPHEGKIEIYSLQEKSYDLHDTIIFISIRLTQMVID